MAADDPIKGGGEVAPASPAPAIPEDATEDEAFDLISVWFRENFEDAMQGMSRHDGGYYYSHGGPHDTADILFGVFGNRLSDEEISHMASLLERNGGDWVPSSHRRLPHDDDDGWDHTDTAGGDLVAAHTEVVRTASATEQSLAALDDLYGGIGHNLPPAPIDDVLLPPIDREEIGRALSLLKTQPVRPESKVRPLVRLAIAKIKSAAVVSATWLATKGDIAADAFAKTLGETAAKRAVEALYALFLALVAAATRWAGLW